MELGELVSFYRRRAGLTIDELADKSGVPKSTINKIIGGTTKAPTLENVKAIAKALGVRLADFDNEPELADMFSIPEQAIIKKYRLLDQYGKEAVDGVLDVESRRCEADRQAKAATLRESREQMEAAEETACFILPYYLHPSSAGTGEYSDGDEWEELTMTKRPPRGASYVIRVHGDSMEPTYYDGDKVFVRAGADVRPGQIGIFIMGREQYIKELGDGVLISHNPDPQYSPRPIVEGTICQGLVLGVCDESYF